LSSTAPGFTSPRSDAIAGENFLLAVTAAVRVRDWPRVRTLCDHRLQLEPEDPDAHRHLGQLLLAEGALDDALGAAERAAALAPEDPRAWSDLGRVHAARETLAEAVRCFRKAVGLDARYADGWHNLGAGLKRLGRTEQAFEALKKALDVEPTRANSWLALGDLLSDAGQAEDALGCFERAVKYDSGEHDARNRLARELAGLGQVARAEALLREATAREPRNVETWLALADILEIGGKADDAVACYDKALALAPTHPVALGRALSLLPRDADLAGLSHRAAERIDAPDIPDEGRALINYGLAKHHERRGAYAEAADAGQRANAARRRAAGELDRDALTSRVDGIVTAYTPEFFAERRRFGVGTHQPVFIVGLPRSGTTLVEQMLSAHPLLHGAGELPDLARLAMQHRAKPGEAPWRAALALDPGSSLAASHTYLEALRRTAPAEPLRISDKSPLNFFHLAFAALLFPNARVIHCTRDLRDNALSVWMENFSPDQQWSTDFSDLAFYAGQYRRLMAHWREALPLPILEVAYEDTVADVEGQARRLLDFLGVPWDDRCLDFHNTGRAVQTPSRWQVREPIYTRSVGRWRRYAEHLPELERAFTALAP